MGLINEEPFPKSKNSLRLPVDEDCVLINGENLEVLLSLVKNGRSKFDFCYIDPPYNTGQDFVYSDRKSGATNGLWGRHDAWMSFMLSRMVVSHELLSSSGIIAISIDDYEYANLKKLMDVVFGEESYIATLIVVRSKNGKGAKSSVAVNHEYVLLYGKTPSADLRGLKDRADGYDKADQHGAYRIDGLFRKKGDASLRSDRPNMYYPLYYSDAGEVYADKVRDDLKVALPIDSKGVERRWLWGVDKARQESWKLYASKSGVVYVKNYSSNDKRIMLRSVLDSQGYLTDKATVEVSSRLGERAFETAKPLQLVKDLIDACCPEQGLVLDFFAGSGTTAEATWMLNREAGATRKVVLVEQKEEISPRHRARSYGYARLCDLTRARLANVQTRDESYVVRIENID